MRSVSPAPGGRDIRNISSRDSAPPSGERNCTITCSSPSAPVRGARDRMTWLELGERRVHESGQT